MWGDMGLFLEMIIKFIKLNWGWSRKKREVSNNLIEIRMFKSKSSYMVTISSRIQFL